MVIFSRQVDQTILIGDKTIITPTDIDLHGIRIKVKGELLGGADDGLRIDQINELGREGQVMIGTQITVVLVDVIGKTARIGVVAPKHLHLTTGEKLEEKKNPLPPSEFND